MRRKAIALAQARAQRIGGAVAVDQAAERPPAVASAPTRGTPPSPPGLEPAHGSPPSSCVDDSEADLRLQRARVSISRMRRRGERWSVWRARIGAPVRGELSVLEKAAARVVKQRENRLRKRQRMEESGLLALGRRRLGLPAVSSEFSVAGHVPAGGEGGGWLVGWGVEGGGGRGRRRASGPRGPRCW
jgi:hypothetical protein